MFVLFHHVLRPNQHRDAGRFAEDPSGIGGADVAAAVLADVLAFDELDEQEPERDCSDKVGCDG